MRFLGKRSINCIYNYNKFLNTNEKQYNKVRLFSRRVQKQALVSYLVSPLISDINKITRTNRSNAINIVRALNELGFIVDIVNWDDKKFIPKRRYNLFIGHGGINFERISKELNYDCIQIYYSTGLYWKLHNKKEIERVSQLNKRRKVNLKPDRYIHNSEEYALNIADGIIALGNEFTKKVFLKFPLVLTLNNAAPSYPKYDISKKIIEKSYNNFLFFSGSGNIHKGLDLVLEAFLEADDKNLYVCTKLDDEFSRVYENELFKTKNIHYIGFVEMFSEKFYEIMNLCNYFIHPSCGEGSMRSAVLCMHHGLIPIVSKETTIDVDGFGYILENCTTKDIVRMINKVVNLDISKKLSENIMKFAKEKYSERGYLKNMKKHIKYIYNFKKDKNSYC